MASASNTPVTFDRNTATRVLKATRAVESQGLEPAGNRNQAFTVEQIIVPTDGPDEDGIYVFDVYIVNDPVAGTYTKVLEDQYGRLL